MDRWLENLQKSPAPARPRPEPARPNVPLQFLDLCELPPGSVGGVDDFGKALNAPEDPLGAFLEKTHLALLVKSPGVSDARWDEPLLAKRTTSSIFTKGTIGHELGIVRTEIRETDGLRFNVGFNAAGEEVGSLQIRE